MNWPVILALEVALPDTLNGLCRHSRDQAMLLLARSMSPSLAQRPRRQDVSPALKWREKFCGRKIINIATTVIEARRLGCDVRAIVVQGAIKITCGSRATTYRPDDHRDPPRGYLPSESYGPERAATLFGRM